MSLIKGINVGSTNVIGTYGTESDSAPIEVTAVSLQSIDTPSNSIYTGISQEPTPIVRAIVGGEIVVLTKDEDYTLSYTTDHTNVGQKTVTATGINNFTGTVSANWTIYPKEVSLQWGDLSWVYNGDAHSTTCEVSNLVFGDTCTVTLTGNSITNIGTTTVTATGLSNSNYKLPSSGLTVTITVLPGMFVKISGVWTPVKKVYRMESGSWVLKGEVQGELHPQTLDAVLREKEAYIKV